MNFFDRDACLCSRQGSVWWRHAWCRVIIDADVNLWLERARASQESLEWEVVHVKELFAMQSPSA